MSIIMVHMCMYPNIYITCTCIALGAGQNTLAVLPQTGREQVQIWWHGNAYLHYHPYIVRVWKRAIHSAVIDHLSVLWDELVSKNV